MPTIEELGYSVGFVGEMWSVIKPDGSHAAAIDSDICSDDDLQTAFGGLHPEWHADLA
jgi:hypothetical protein